ncbi:ATP-binding protein [Streptomyces qinzhouensis]|uniref:ATP-binding protein n=1 Tax=Streptomyces qinzhouensis TaxID=2599401 RepID=A0A5B8IMX1_9ACTN|nr:ATP-binding protein [Streptomyces qinzhouensis]QDY79952.1 ATP-binding protein [Streptomyces qinzhouensis]
MESRGSVPAWPAAPYGGPGGTGAEPGPVSPRAPVGEGVWRFTAPTVESSVPRARHAVRELLEQQGVPAGGAAGETVQGLLLIVSELVTNVVKHAAVLSPQLAVEVALAPGRVRVAVEDNHPYRPTVLETDWGRTGGRGLLLVREITREAGGRCDVEHTTSGGKVIRVELPLGPG